MVYLSIVIWHYRDSNIAAFVFSFNKVLRKVKKISDN